MGRTRGIETSKYPVEEKSIEILLVAASERGTGQTKELALWGCRSGAVDCDLVVELAGKPDHRG